MANLLRGIGVVIFMAGFFVLMAMLTAANSYDTSYAMRDIYKVYAFSGLVGGSVFGLLLWAVGDIYATLRPVAHTE